MVALSSNKLMQRIEDPTDELCITPILDWKRQFTGASIDLRLDNQFIIIKRTSLSCVNPVQKNFAAKINQFQKLVKIPYGEKFVLHPNELVIGSTLEFLSFPKDLVAYVIGRSSWGRLGLIIATATVINPCFKGNLTLELVNSGNVPIELYPGARIAQLTFHQILNPAKCKEKETEKYYLQIGPGFSKIHKDPELKYLSLPKYKIAIGIIGHKGSGKQVITSYLTEDKQYKLFSLSHIVRKQYLAEHYSEEKITRKQLQDYGDELRLKKGKDYFARLAINEIRESVFDQFAPIVIVGIKNPGELETLKKLPNFHVVGIKAAKNKIKENMKKTGYIPKIINVKQFNENYNYDSGRHNVGDHGQNISKCLDQIPKSNIVTFSANDNDFDLIEKFKFILEKIE